MDKLDFTRPFAILMALLSFVLVSGAPIYCGWRILDRRGTKKPLAATASDKIFGAITILLGTFYGALFAYSMGSALRDMTAGFPPDGAGIVVLGLPFAAVGGTACCGASLCTTGPLIPRAWSRCALFSGRDNWRTFMGGCSLLAGVMGFIMVFVAMVARATS